MTKLTPVGRRKLVATLCGLTTVAGLVAGATRVTASATTISPAPQARPATSADGAQLLAAYLAARSLPSHDVSGIRPGSVHIAHLPAQSADWAIATFVPAVNAPPGILVSFQDGGSSGIFTRPDGGGSGQGLRGPRPEWRMVRTAGAPFACGTDLPSGLRARWALPDACTSAPSGNRLMDRTAVAGRGFGGIQEVAEAEVGVSDNPSSQQFSYDCNPFTTLAGGYGTQQGCGVDPTFGVTDANEEWCADFAKWVWERAGVNNTNLGVLNPGAVSFYRWGLDLGESMPADGHDARVGDAIVLFAGAPTTVTADHVGIVTAVNADGTINVVNGDFLTGSTIAVQEDDHVSPGPWSAAVEGNPGEQWVYVHPVGAPTAGIPTRQAAMVQRPGGETDVLGAAPNGQLSYFFNPPGVPRWFGGPLAGVYGVNPVMVQRPSGETDVVATAGSGQLVYFFNRPGSPTWYGGPIAGVYGVNPAVVQRPSGETDVVATAGSGQLVGYANPPGSRSWYGGQIAGAYGVNPAVAQRPSGETDVVATAPNGRLLLASLSPGQSAWSVRGLGGASGTNPVALVRATTRAGAQAGELDVVARGPHGQLEYLAEPAGTSAWRQEPIPGAFGTAPVAVQRETGPTAGETDVVASGPDIALTFYFGTPTGTTWGGGPI